MKAVSAGLAPAIVLLFAACSMSQHIVLNADGSGSAQVQVTLGPLVTQYLTDVLGSLGPDTAGPTAGPPLFDLAQIRRAFADLPGVTLTGLSTPARNVLHLRLAFADVNALVPVPGGTEAAGLSTAGTDVPIDFSTHAGVSTLAVHLSRKSWSAIAALPALASNPLIATLGPLGAKSSTKSEYLSLLDYAFADYASKKTVRQALYSSKVVITVNVQGTIVSQTGGARAGRSVVYHIPLLQIATLENPIDLSVSFRS